MNSIKLKMLVLIANFLICSYSVLGQCTDTSNIYSFVHDGKIYEVIKENKTWVDAAACAVERGGILTEINDTSEQNAIFTELNSNAGINVNNTVAPDGGGGSYVWIGGNDLSVEGNWVWDGDNDNNGTQFWMGTSTGNPVGGLYNNWGNEPDDFQGQDALGLSLNGWPFGVAGQWNDVDHINTLYFVVEHSAVLPIELLSFTAHPLEKQIQLVWTTASEINNSGFEIERSSDGIDFKKITWQSGFGNSQNEIRYIFDDKSVSRNQIYYYRLRQIDLDGKFEFSNIVEAKILGEASIKISPNPTSDEINVTVSDDLKNESLSFEIYDILGKQVFYKTIDLKKEPSFQFSFQNANFSRGIYFLKIRNMNQEIVSKKLIFN